MINLSKFLPFFIPNVYRACSFFFTNLDLFCIDNARVIYRKIRLPILIVIEENISESDYPDEKSWRPKICRRPRGGNDRDTMADNKFHKLTSTGNGEVFPTT